VRFQFGKEDEADAAAIADNIREIRRRHRGNEEESS